MNAGPPRPPHRERLEALVVLLPEFEDRTLSLGSWGGGERRPNGDLAMPHWEIGPAGERFLAAVARGGWIYPFNWPAWLSTPDGQAMRNSPERLGQASPEDLARLLTAIVRSERFSDGSIEGAFRSGLIARILRRAQALLEEELEAR